MDPNRNSVAEEYNEIKHNEDSINSKILLSKSKNLGTWKQVFQLSNEEKKKEKDEVKKAYMDYET